MKRRELLEAISLGTVVGTLGLGRKASGQTNGLEPERLADAYKKIFASTRDENVCCWYLGTMYMQPVGYPRTPVLQAVTIMVYRVDDNVPSGFRMRWTEVGYFRDAVTGAPATAWLNPLTGETVPTPRTFRDGPGEYRITPDGNGLVVRLRQPRAVVEGVEVALSVAGSRIFLQQVERKRRRLSTSSESSDAEPPRAVTTLSLWADRNQVQDPARVSVAASGTYSFESEGLPGLRGLNAFEGTTLVRGVMRKAPVDEVVNPAAWEVLKPAYPDFFGSDGVAPQWGS